PTPMPTLSPYTTLFRSLPDRLRVRSDDDTVTDLHRPSHTAGLPVSPVPFVRSVPLGPDCGLTSQAVNDRPQLEVGYHVKASAQGNGYAPEATQVSAPAPHSSERGWGMRSRS